MQFRFLSVLSVLLTILLAAPPAALAEKKVALVIGNAEYEHAGRLKNPRNDAELLAKTLEPLGFEVIKGVDAGQKSVRRLVREFLHKLVEYGTDTVGLFYFAGHGLQVAGENYLVPIDANIDSEAEVAIEAIDAGSILTGMQQAKNRLNIVILDACRNNPFRGFSRAAMRGLARMDAPLGTYIMFATAPGDTAADGEGANSPFTTALARYLATPDLNMEDVHKGVGLDVDRATRGSQHPWLSSSVYFDFFPAGRVSASLHRDPRIPLWAQTQPPAADDPQRDLRLGPFPGKPPTLERKHAKALSWNWLTDTESDGNWGLKSARFVPAWIILRRFRLANPDAPRPSIALLDASFGPHVDLNGSVWNVPNAFERLKGQAQADCGRAHGVFNASIVGALFGNGTGIDGAYPGASLDYVWITGDKATSLMSQYPAAEFWQRNAALYAGAIDVLAEYGSARFGPNSNTRVVLAPLTYNWQYDRYRPDKQPGSALIVETHATMVRQITSAVKNKVLFVAAGGMMEAADKQEMPDAKWASPFAWASFVGKASNIIVVGSHGRNGQRSEYSASGTPLLAPGEDLLGLAPPDRLLACSGPSGASAMAAGLALILFELNPTLTAEQVASLLTSSGRQTDDPAARRIDALAAVLKMEPSLVDFLVDIDENGTIDARDLEKFKALWAEYKATGHASGPFDWRTLDLNGDGKIDNEDIDMLRRAWPGRPDTFTDALKQAGLE